MPLSEELRGLDRSEAEKRIEKYGFNELAERRLANLVESAAKLLSDPMGAMLLGLSATYWMLGKTTDAIILGCA
ncbi:MAG: hypothetical protein JST04_15295 [Bdellovibrionales bacterium]|nr:hypothetical protein [Bdellovibrionales bacterium]